MRKRLEQPKHWKTRSISLLIQLSVKSHRLSFGDVAATISLIRVLTVHFSPIFRHTLFEYAQTCTELHWRGEDKANQNCITTKKKPAREKLLIVSPFQRPEAVRGLFVQGPAQWRTQALVHEKLQCTKQLGLKGKAAWCYKPLFYVLLSVSPRMSYSLTSLLNFPHSSVTLCLSLSLRFLRFVLGRTDNIQLFLHSFIWQFSLRRTLHSPTADHVRELICISQWYRYWQFLWQQQGGH